MKSHPRSPLLAGDPRLLRTGTWSFVLAVLVLSVLAIVASGCSSGPSATQKNATTLLGKVAGMNISANDVTQTTTGPFYNHSESVTSFNHHPDGSFDLAKLSAEFNIPFPVMGIPFLHWTFTANAISGTSVQAVPKLLPSSLPPPQPPTTAPSLPAK